MKIFSILSPQVIRRPAFLSLGLALLMIAPNQLASAQSTPPQNTTVTAVYTYADVADVTLDSSLVILVKIKSAKALKKEQATGVAPDRKRFLVSSDVITLIRGREGINPRISYLIDLKRDSRGQYEKLPGKQFIVFAIPGKPGTATLVRADSQIPDSPEAQTMVRRILTDVLKPNAPPKITAISSAFMTPGTLPGESETQIFLESDDERPVSITVKREQGKQPNWVVAVGETVDDGAGPPRRSTLLWYRLACTLPTTLPDSALEERTAEMRELITRDYTLVMETLGPCRRLRS